MELSVHEVLGKCGAWFWAGGDLEQAWAHTDDAEGGQAGRHGVAAHSVPGLVEVEGDPRSAVGAVRALVKAEDLGVEIGPADLARQGRSVLGRSPAVIAGRGNLQQAGHAGDLEVRALDGHQRKSFCFGGFEAKYAAAFPRKARSLSISATWRRSRNSSVRSAAVNGSSEVPATVSIRRRSSRTHRASELSTTESSAATSTTDRPVSITRCAASVLNSSVNFRLVAPIIEHPSSRPQSQPVRCPQKLGNLKPPARAQRSGERLAAPRARRCVGQKGPVGGHGRPRGARPGRSSGSFPRPALGGRAATGVDRPGRGGGAPTVAGRRAL